MKDDDDNPFVQRPPWQRHARWLAFGVVGSFVLVLALGGVVARGDVLKALLVEHDPALAVGVVVLFCSRAFLLVLAPGWALFAAVLYYQDRSRR